MKIAKKIHKSQAVKSETPDFFLNPTIRTIAVIIGMADKIATKN